MRDVTQTVCITCPTCNRAGYVKRKPRAIATEVDSDQFVSLRETIPEKRLKEAPEDGIAAFVLGSCSIGESCAEAIEVAKSEGKPVFFDFNGHLVVCKADDDANTVARDWWVRANGETYEETMARR